MANYEEAFKYGQLDTYKEELELEHIRRKSIIVNIILLLLSIVVVYFVVGQGVGLDLVMPALLVFAIIFVINVLYFTLSYDQYVHLKLAMYVTIIGIYGIAMALIYKFETPSIFTVLFLAFAIISIYQDFKAMGLSSFLLFITGGVVILYNPNMFALVQSSNPETFYLVVFLTVFVLLLTLSSYILIKRKAFFYNQLASIKESEIRNIKLMKDMEYLKTKKEDSFNEYYEGLETFSKELSKKIGVGDLFGRRIEILKDLKTKKPSELVNKYPDFELSELEELALMEFTIGKKMKNLSIKASKSVDIQVDKKEIFSESQFKSFSHFSDSMYTKIISFAVFYTLLKVNKPYLKALKEEELREILVNSEYQYRIDRDVFNVYLENSKVFDTIVDDYLKGGW